MILMHSQTVQQSFDTGFEKVSLGPGSTGGKGHSGLLSR